MNSDDSDDITVAPDGRPSGVQPLWRKDFAIDWPRDEIRSRRHFIYLLGLTSLAFVAGQAWIVALSVIRRWRPRPAELEIARVNDLPVGGSRLFHYPGKTDPCLLVRLADDRFVAFGQKCTHLSCPVIPQPEKGRFFCPCHSGSFDLASGYPLAGPPRRPLPRITLEVRDGRVFATGIDLRAA